jgi:citrate lyase subunit beta/citryl-CoA lyase
VEAFAAPENAGAAVIRVDGRMVERLHLEDARRVLSLAGIDSASALGD